MRRKYTKCILIFFVVMLFVLLFSQSFLVFAVDTKDSWTIKASMPTGRIGARSVTTSNGMIYVIGGSGGSGGSGVNELYNPVTDSWVTRTSMPTHRDYFGIAAYQNKVYAIGGVGDFGGEEVTGVNEVYDAETDTWETKTAMPTARGYMCANIVNGKIYVIGGSKPVNWLNLGSVRH